MDSNSISQQKFIIVKTYKDDKYGRMLADVFYAVEKKNISFQQKGLLSFANASKRNGISNFAEIKLSDPAVVAENGIFLNQQLVDEGLAKVWVG